MKPEWFVIMGGQQHGPYTSAEMEQYYRSGQIEPGDLVWREGMPDWKPVTEVVGSKPLAEQKGATPSLLPDLDVPDLEPIPTSTIERSRIDIPSKLETPVSSPKEPDEFRQAVNRWGIRILLTVAMVVVAIRFAGKCSCDCDEGNEDEGEETQSIGSVLPGLTDERTANEFVEYLAAREMDRPQLDALAQKTGWGDVEMIKWKLRWFSTDLQKDLEKMGVAGEGNSRNNLHDLIEDKNLTLKWQCRVYDLVDSNFVCSVTKWGSWDFFLVNSDLIGGHYDSTKPISQGTKITPITKPDQVYWTDTFGGPILTLVYNDSSNLRVKASQ